VLPFENISNDPENEYFSYGLTEDTIRLLARNRWLSVISRHSTIGFLGSAVDTREVGAQLGATYVMSGSVRKSDGSVRIAAELARAADGQQLWSEKYEFQLLNIFDIQDEMARQIAATIEPELSKVEQQLAACQSAFDWDPLSASKRDPFERRALLVALGSSELVGVAETARARVV
jgi:TolB-like protein